MKQVRLCSLFAITLMVMVGGRLPAASAQTEGKPSLLVLHIDADGLSDGQKKEFHGAIVADLAKYKKFEVMETPAIDLLDEMVNFECLERDGDCLAKIGKKNNVDWVLYSNWADGKLTLKLAEVATGEVTQSDEAALAKKEVGAAAGQKSVVKLWGPLPKEPTLVDVKLDANVQEAEVFINQTRVGITPLTVKLKPGKYTVAVRKKDFLMVEEKITVTGPMEWQASLKPVPKEPDRKVVVTPPVGPAGGEKDKKKQEDDEVTPFYGTWWFWTAVGVVTAAAVGGTVYALSGDSGDVDVGTVKFSINPTAAEKDAIFYR